MKEKIREEMGSLSFGCCTNRKSDEMHDLNQSYEVDLEIKKSVLA